MNFQTILNFFTNPIGIMILIGAFSALSRVAKSAQEQQAKKKALAKMKSESRDALRTGARASSEPTSQSATAQASTPQASTSTQSSSKNATWDQKQDLRRERIQKLRDQQAQRLEQAKQRRQSTTNPQSAQSNQSAPQNQVTSANQSARQQPGQQSNQQQSPRQRFGSQKQRQQAQARSPQQTQQARQTQQPAPHAAQQRRREQSERLKEEQRTVSRTPAVTPSNAVASGSLVGDTSIQPDGTPKTVRQMIRSDLRRAIISKEVFGTPLGLRAPGSETTGAN